VRDSENEKVRNMDSCGKKTAAIKGLFIKAQVMDDLLARTLEGVPSNPLEVSASWDRVAKR